MGISFPRWACSALALVFAFAACSGGEGGAGDGGESACGEVERIMDSRGPTHVVDVEAVEYDHHPPTSGPHFAGNPPEPGVHDEPLPEAMQVLALEVEMVVLQYDDSVADDAGSLEVLAEGRKDVIVMPAATPLDGGSAVAFTAWGLRQRCADLSDSVLAAARDFVTAHAG